MINLLKVDLKRILKDKLLVIVCIIALVMSLFTPLLLKGLLVLGLDMEWISSKEGVALGFFSNAFSASSNIGLILPIFIAIIINKDFTYGTIRNKIICGNKRSTIFLSMFISSAIITVAIMIIQALITLLATIIVFNGVSFNSGDISSSEYAKAIEEYRNSMADILDVDAENVTEDFLLKNKELVKLAA